MRLFVSRAWFICEFDCVLFYCVSLGASCAAKVHLLLTLKVNPPTLKVTRYLPTFLSFTLEVTLAPLLTFCQQRCVTCRCNAKISYDILTVITTSQITDGLMESVRFV